jgi:lycopene beta-cyclase
LLQRLESAGVSCTWGCSSVEATANTITFDSTSVDFDLVVDAAFNPDTRGATLWQSFGGLWVSSKKPLFDPQVATLMDLDVPDSHASVRFMYILPTSSTTALLEHTVFARIPLSRDEHLAACQEWAARQGFNDLEICEKEYGRIPMGLQPLSQANKPLTIGTAGGAIRISTGYGFQGILREVKQLAQLIASARARGEELPAKAPALWPTWMRLCDSLFVKALAKQPMRGQFIMTELLRRAPESALIPFLSGTASFAQALQVMKCAPAWDMIQALTTVSDTHGEATV